MWEGGELYVSPLSRRLNTIKYVARKKDTDRGVLCLSTPATMIDTTAGKHWGVYPLGNTYSPIPQTRPLLSLLFAADTT
jgi:hypothetical protein